MRLGALLKSGRAETTKLNASGRPLSSTQTSNPMRFESGGLGMWPVCERPTTPHSPNPVAVNEFPCELRLIFFFTLGAIEDGRDDHARRETTIQNHK